MTIKSIYMNRLQEVQNKLAFLEWAARPKKDDCFECASINLSGLSGMREIIQECRENLAYAEREIEKEMEVRQKLWPNDNNVEEES